MNASKKFLRQMVKKLRAALDVEVVDVTDLTTKARRDELCQAAKERRNTTRALREFKIADPSDRYDIEYSTTSELAKLTGVPCSFQGTHYWFWSPILEPTVISPILQSLPESGKVLDIGAGNGTLLQRISGFGFSQLLGVDISKQACERIKDLDIESFEGTMPLLTIDQMIHRSKRNPRGKFEFDAIFLSYFVDRDNDQRTTFKESVEALPAGGRLVLEGLFPCILEDSSGVSYGTANVTRGEDVVGDIRLVVENIQGCSLDEPWEADALLERIVVGQRLVYSMDGPEVLPSYILVFRKMYPFAGSH